MAYLTQADLETVIPAPVLADALDDNRDGVADDGLLAQVISSASSAVDACLAGRFPVPFADPVPAAVKEAALAFACELVQARRAASDEKSPFPSRARYWRDRLEKISQGKLPLDAQTPGAFTPGAALLENLTTYGTTR